MRILHRSLALTLIPATMIGAAAVYIHGGASYAQMIEAPKAFIDPSYVQAGVPFLVRDNYATLLCISNHAGQPLQPFISPGDWPAPYALGEAPAHVTAGVPFTVREGTSTQWCISTRSGRPIPPFIAPR